jgi:cytochrome c oxidase cbb3-type subunit III
MSVKPFAGKQKLCYATSILLMVAAYMVAANINVLAQQQAQPNAEHGATEAPAPPAGGGQQRGGLVAYPDRAKAPQEVLDRGKAQFSVNCAFCHGSDAAGGSVGPNLLRSEVVLQDKSGELMGPIVHGARADRGMPKLDLSDAQVQDIAAWLHSLKVSSRSLVHEKINIVVGDATAGKEAFAQNCESCHKNGELANFAARFTDARAMQQAWIMPGGGGGRGPGANVDPAVALKVPPVTATVTPASGPPITGQLDAIDDFYVQIATTDGVVHRFNRWNDVPKVEIHDPLAQHRAMLRTITDKQIHDITAYLESQK